MAEDSKAGHFYVGVKSIEEEDSTYTSLFLSTDPTPPEESPTEDDAVGKDYDSPDNFDKAQRAFFTQMHAFLTSCQAARIWSQY